MGHFLSFYLPPKNLKNHFEKKKFQEIPSFYMFIPKTTYFFIILGHFFPLTSSTDQKIKILKKWKHLEMSSFYTCIPKVTILWCALPEIWSATDIIFCHFGPFFTLLPSPLPTPLPLTTHNIKILKKKKKKPGDIFILHMCNINDNHMMYGFWYMKHDGETFF